MIKTWQQRCEEHPDHEGIVTHQMIMERMQEEIDELRQAIAPLKREWVGLSDEEREHFRKLGFVGVLAVENKLKEKNT